jgi:SAM-dependent methyltransferase
MLKSLAWSSPSEFSLDGINFVCTLDDYSLKSDGERFALLKSQRVLDQYRTVFADKPPKTILELGIFQGGSAALFSAWFDVEKFVGVDFCKPVAAFDAFCKSHPIGQRVKAYYGVSQTDKAALDKIIGLEFAETPLELIIDDASHLYKNTRRTFEICFPYLKPGGTYVIEDWGWAHWKDSKMFPNETPMSLLLMELLMFSASRRDLIDEVRVFPSFAFIHKSEEAPAIPDFSLNYPSRGLEFSTYGDLNFIGPLRLFCQKLARRLRR